MANRKREVPKDEAATRLLNLFLLLSKYSKTGYPRKKLYNKYVKDNPDIETESVKRKFRRDLGYLRRCDKIRVKQHGGRIYVWSKV